jgi:tRNA G10  N-methylase Trm11
VIIYPIKSDISRSVPEMQVEIIDKSELRHFISPRRNQNFGIHNWHLFKHGFSKELISELVNYLHLTKGNWVLDPYCGGATTLLACKELGINSRGFDILPFSVFLSNVKVKDYDDKELLKQFKALKRKKLDYDDNRALPDIPIVEKAFQPDVATKLLSIKSTIEKNIKSPKVRAFFNLGFLDILESVSNTSKTGGFLRITDRRVNPDEIWGLFLGKVDSMIQDVVQLNKNGKRKKVSSSAKIGDARKLPTKRKFDAVITSPPYPNRHDYTRIYSLEMMFDFISDNDQLKKIRYETIRSHVEARKRYEAVGYEQPEVLKSLLSQVKRNGTNNPQVISMLEGYFEDMYLSLSEIHRCLKDGGRVAMVISNVRFAGVNIPVDELLSEIGVQAGLTQEEIWAVRYRGNSSQQMRDYKRVPSRESIIFWEKND